MDRRALIRQIVEGYQNVRLREQDDDGSVVVEARDKQSRAPVQIRIFPHLLRGGPQIASQFRQLARAIRNLDHPSIVAGEIGQESGLPYAVNRMLQQLQPLAQRLDQPWALESIANLAESVGDALEHAYQQGIVHGGLSPENILVDAEGRVHVSELGLAQLKELLGASVRDSMSPYLAPERVAGEPASPASDVYSLGVVVYSLLARRLPARRAGDLVPASQFNDQVSPRLDAVLARALAPDPKARYAGLAPFLADLRRAMQPAAGSPEPAREAIRCPNCGTPDQTGRFCRACGTQLREPPPTAETPMSKLDEPIQKTKIDIGAGAEVLELIETTPIDFDTPISVAEDEISGDFPEPLPMPQIALEDLWSETSGRPPIAMPTFLEMPDVNWDALVPPLPQVPKIEEAGRFDDEEEPEA